MKDLETQLGACSSPRFIRRRTNPDSETELLPIVISKSNFFTKADEAVFGFEFVQIEMDPMKKGRYSGPISKADGEKATKLSHLHTDFSEAQQRKITFKSRMLRQIKGKVMIQVCDWLLRVRNEQTRT